LKFIEDNWNLRRLGRNDARANSIDDAFDFSQPPRHFTPIKVRYSQRYFERERPSGRPIDDG
jgi:hypothetical protein